MTQKKKIQLLDV